MGAIVEAIIAAPTVIAYRFRRERAVYEEKKRTVDSDTEFVLYPSWRAHWFECLLIVICSYYSVSLNKGGFDFVYDFNVGGIVFSIPVLMIPVAVLLIRIIYKKLNFQLLISKKEVRQISGALWFMPISESGINYENVFGVEYQASVMGRILNYGTIIAGTAMVGSAEIRMKGIYDAEWFSDLIEKRAQEHQEQFSDPEFQQIWRD